MPSAAVHGPHLAVDARAKVWCFRLLLHLHHVSAALNTGQSTRPSLRMPANARVETCHLGSLRFLGLGMQRAVTLHLPLQLQFAALALHLPSSDAFIAPDCPVEPRLAPFVDRSGMARLSTAPPCPPTQSAAGPHHGRKSLGIRLVISPTAGSHPDSSPSLLFCVIIPITPQRDNEVALQ
ncbi:hypothetical protein NOR_07925 [Metarhizium rileyi]|uniref:Uncharacterized protein n=1 Tax=Metarhizium rileyi (strain RCEF 4871) TaxID=1649241 RepID=A0A166X8L1_METRR|nr:hypothetical protein NOR_07925 [Metarhizium rileyi RCEF 4871]